MNRVLILTFSIIFLTGCIKTSNNTGSLKVTLYESYELNELFPSILKANELIRKAQLESKVNKSSGLALLDKINEQNAKDTIHGNSSDDFPLLQVLLPNTRQGDDGKVYLDTSAIIAFTLDSTALKHYLKQTASLFPNDLEWKITGKPGGTAKCLHAIKKNHKKEYILDSDIDSVFVLQSHLPGILGSFAEKIADLGVSKYWVNVKLKKEVSSRIGNRVYTLIMETDSIQYSGSIVNFQSNPHQRVMIGEMGQKDFQILKTKFGTRMEIKK